MEPLIREYPDWQAASAAQLLEFFSEPITRRHSRRLNGNDLAKLLTTEVACELAETLRAAGFGLVTQSIASVGIDFGDDETQRMLDKLAMVPGFADHVADLKALGSTTKTRWQWTYGDNEPLPSEAAIEAAVARAKHQDRCDAAIQVFSATNRNDKSFDELVDEVSRL